MKYIVTRDKEGNVELFMFPKRYNHDEFASMVNGLKTFKHGNHREWERSYKEPIAAGFTDGKTCHGRSESLNLDSRGRIDELLIG